MTPFTLTEISLLLDALEAWEGKAEHDIAQQAIHSYVDKAMKIFNNPDTPQDEKIDLVSQLQTNKMVQYTGQEAARLKQRRNEPGVLLKARLILMKRDIERQVTDGVAADLFKIEGGGDGSEVQ